MTRYKHLSHHLSGLTVVFLLIVISTLPIAAATPSVTVGPFNIRLESISRSLDLTLPAGRQASTVLILLIEGPLDEISRITDPLKEVTGMDDCGTRLTFRETRILNRSTPPSADKAVDPTAQGKIRVQVKLSAAAGDATKLADLSASLVSYEQHEHVQLDFLSVTGEPPALQYLDGAKIRPSFPTPQQIKARGAYDVKVYVRMSAASAKSSIQWSTEEIEIIDSQGKLRKPLSTSRTYQYDDRGQVVGRTISASFMLPSQPPRGVRYRVDRLQGTQEMSYRFTHLPLP